jgi:hypothetical protein
LEESAMLKRIALAVTLCGVTVTAAADDAAVLDAGDLAAQWQSLVGQRVMLTGGYVGVAYIVDKKYPKAYYGRQGMKAILIDAAGVDPAAAAALDPDCRPYTEEQLALCAYDVTAMVVANSAGDGPKLSEPVFVHR